MHIRVFNYNTMEKIQAWEAHTDYIRFLEVHPTQPYVLSASDDMSIKLWDWERQWDCTQVFEGHSHYVMMVRFNLKDSNTFASASLDRQASETPIKHKPSGSDDRTVKIWDYQTKTCVQTLEGHTNNVSAVLFHKRLPIIISGGEDGTVRLWHSTTYRAETTLNYGMERVWALAASPDNNKVAIGFDEGTVVLKLGHEMPVASLDTHTGKVVWALNSEIQTASLKGLVTDASDASDGERLAIVPKGQNFYYIGGEIMTLCHLEHPMYMLGYLPKEDRVYMMDKQQNMYSYRVRRAMLQYQTAVVRKDFDVANSILPSIPKGEYTAVARFLESQGFKAEAFQDLGGLLLLHSSTGNREGMLSLAEDARRSAAPTWRSSPFSSAERCWKNAWSC
ncbi:unnamed protein product [Ascophyllum nodosum]